jgi:hypothetical protein
MKTRHTEVAPPYPDNSKFVRGFRDRADVVHTSCTTGHGAVFQFFDRLDESFKPLTIAPALHIAVFLQWCHPGFVSMITHSLGIGDFEKDA